MVKKVFKWAGLGLLICWCLVATYYAVVRTLVAQRIADATYSLVMEIELDTTCKPRLERPLKKFYNILEKGKTNG